ncbi:hypothetical protein P4200_22470 [Pseudomonas aeruginosa]|nr:hypothetical protein [Pseudomonas aeruginosa]
MSAVSTSLLLFLQPADPGPGRPARKPLAMAPHRDRCRREPPALFRRPCPGELQLLDLEVDRGRVHACAPPRPTARRCARRSWPDASRSASQAGEPGPAPDLQRRRRHRTDPDPRQRPHPADPGA